MRAMKPKKDPGADLKNRRALFFESGMIVALAAAIVAFSVGSKEKVIDMPVAADKWGDRYEIDRTVTKPEKTEASRRTISVIADIFDVVKNDTWIDTDIRFPDFDYDVPELPPIDGRLETIDEKDVYVTASEMPSFLGGDLNTFRKWVSDRLRYPVSAQEVGIEGKVVVQFIVEKDGSISNVTVARTPDKVLSDEVVRILAMSPKWEPGKQRNMPVRIRYTLPIDFTIPK